MPPYPVADLILTYFLLVCELETSFLDTLKANKDRCVVFNFYYIVCGKNVKCSVFHLYYGEFAIYSYSPVMYPHFALLKVMLGGKNIEEGFGIAYRVIQVCLD